ncbi:MAG: 50S ribosomal protein L3 N(5)-glutamine methyltransferase [Pseudomonadota bacterium]|nr:50S ribosomal protein L3 N(5)-glutamine methyltransferase [Pseudomonadota bacterium]
MKLSTCIENAAAQLDSAGVFFGHGTDNAWDEAAWLILHALEIPVDEEADLNMAIDSSQQEAIDTLLQQRIDSRRPAAYLTGTAWFAGLPFHTAEGVIVPRSHIGGFLLEHGRPWIQPGKVSRILDLCTGSGCIAVAAAMAFPDARVDATDVDPLALSLAEKNINEYQMENRVQLIESDLYQNLSETYDLILTNPPYVPAGEISHFPAEYQHEPAAAFDGGNDGLDLVHTILADASRFLTPNGYIVMEVGESWTTLEHAYPKAAFNWIETGVEDSGLFIMSREELAQHFS